MLDKKYGIQHTEDGIFYKKIEDYEEYTEMKKIWTQLYDMTQNDFQNYFVMMITLAKSPKLDLILSNITADENTTYIELSELKEASNKDIFFSVKVSKEYSREKIEIKKVPVAPYLEKYTNMTQLAMDYSLEQAMADNCFVLKDNKIVSSNQRQLDDFIEETKEGKEDFIRIVSMLNKTEVIDIQHKDKKYIVAEYKLDTNNDSKINYMICDNIIKRNIEQMVLIEVTCNSIDESKAICTIQQ